MVGLGNVSNTSDASKTFTQSQIEGLTAALGNKAPTASPVFTTQAVLQRDTGDTVFNIRTLDATGKTSVLFTSNTSPNTTNGRLLYYSTGLLQWRQNGPGTGFTGVVGFEVLPNGVFSAGSKTNNKVLVIFDQNSSENPTTATNFYGFGYNAGMIRYQTPSTGNSHMFMCGSVQALNLSNASSTFSGTVIAPNITVSAGGTLTTPAITLGSTSLATILSDRAS